MASGITVPTDAYVTLAELASRRLPHRKYDATSKPTAAEAENIIKDVAATINAALTSLGYSPPLTGSSDGRVLKRINSLGAAAEIEAATLASLGGGDSDTVTSYGMQYENEMDALRSGKYVFQNQGAATRNEADVNDDLDESGDMADPMLSVEDPVDSEKF